jgi:hypothetical protein
MNDRTSCPLIYNKRAVKDVKDEVNQGSEATYEPGQ